MSNSRIETSKGRQTQWVIPILLTLGLSGVIVGVSPNFRWSDAARSSPFGSDFHQEWVAGYIIWEGDRSRLYDQEYFDRIQHSPGVIGYEWNSENYYPSPYPPYYYLVVSPLAKGDLKVAVWAWVAILILSWIVAFVVLGHALDSLPLQKLTWAMPGFLFFSPVLQNMTMAQKGTILLALFVIAFSLRKHNWNFLAGGVLGLVAFKPHLVVVPTLLLLFQRQWKSLAGLCCTGIGLVAVSLLFFGQQVCLDWIQLVSGFGDYLQTSGYSMAESHSWWGAVNLLLQGVPVGIRNALSLLLCAATLGVLIVSCRGRPDVDSSRFDWQWGATMCAVVLCSPHLYTYDATLLVFPLLIALLSDDTDRKLQYVAVFVFVMIVPGIWLAEHLRLPVTVVLIAWLFALMVRRSQVLKSGPSEMVPVAPRAHEGFGTAVQSSNQEGSRI